MTTTAYDDQFTPRPVSDLVQQARQRVAARYVQPFHKRAILSGDWDAGALIQSEIRAIKGEEQGQ
jgi:hypothetical protein